MSDFNEKLERPGPSIGTKARAKRKQLDARSGAFTYVTEPDSIEPYEIWVMSMGVTEVWKLVSGRGQEALFERTDN